jgi:hypothetical protein
LRYSWQDAGRSVDAVGAAVAEDVVAGAAVVAAGADDALFPHATNVATANREASNTDVFITHSLVVVVARIIRRMESFLDL